MLRRWLTPFVLLLCLAGFLPTRGGTIVEQADRPSPMDTLTSPLGCYTEGIKQLHIAQDTVGAMAAFEQALKLDTTYGPAHYKLAEIYLAKDAFESAIGHARAAYQSDTTNKFYLSVYAQSQATVGDKGCIQSLRRLLTLDRRNLSNYRILALCEEYAGNRKEGIAVLDSAEILFGKNPVLRGVKQRMLLQDGQRERALQEALEEVESAPYDVDAVINLGHVYRHIGNDSLSRSTYYHALSLDTSRLETLITLAEMHGERKEYRPYLSILRRIFAHPDFPLEEKVSSFQRFTSDIRFYGEHYAQLNTLIRTLALHYPKSPQVIRLYADHLIASGEPEQALALYKLHLQDEPPQLEYYTMTSELEQYLERPDSAYHYISEAISRFPDSTMLYLHRGSLQIRQKRYEEAEKDFEEGLRRSENDDMRSVIWGYLGDSYQMRGCGDFASIEEACAAAEQDKKVAKHLHKWMNKCYKAYDRALQYNHDNDVVMNNYAYFLALEGRNLERALTLSSHALALDEREPTRLDTHAWVLYRLGRYEEAKPLLLQAVQLDGQRSPTLQLHYGDVLEALGEHFMAEVYWKRALENGAQASEVERRLEEQRLKRTPAKP